MKTRQRIEITAETEQVIILRRAHRVTAWCPVCAAEVEMVLPETAALLTGLSCRQLFRRVEDQRLHFQETPDGRLFFCLNSLQLSIGD